MDLSPQWREIRAGLLPAIERLFESSAFSSGPYVARFEEEIAAYLGVRHAVAVNSGSSALHLAVIAAGLSAGDRVLVPAHTFIGSVWGLLYHGVTPVLCDVEPETGTIDVRDAERRVGPGARAIIAVHLYGQPADMTAIGAFAERHGLVVIEDAAQAIGARHAGRPLGSIGGLGCFSFYPGKNLGAAGEGGLVTCADAALAERVRTLRDHGQSTRYVHEEIGYNYRMDGMQALVLSHKLPRLDAWTAQRRMIARRYGAALRDCPVRLPRAVHGDHVWHLYVIRAARRDQLRQFLGERGIETGLHYPVPLPRQPCLAPFVRDPDAFPIADRYAAEALSLPLFAGMRDDQQDQVIEAVRAFFASGPEPERGARAVPA
ncbi:MAG TPA: DegT/DnrJ/EryC1/StrS family aminotransferase [Acetobacteraceae bacterium]|nr:DegT/DnrJ/EryC1/StrS family aminotransferase [Acetobacteraceae bacterium]